MGGPIPSNALLDDQNGTQDARAGGVGQDNTLVPLRISRLEDSYERGTLSMRSDSSKAQIRPMEVPQIRLQMSYSPWSIQLTIHLKPLIHKERSHRPEIIHRKNWRVHHHH